MKKILLCFVLFFSSFQALATTVSIDPRSPVAQIVTNYTTTNVGTSSKVQIQTALTSPVSLVDVFDSSGQTLLLVSTLSATDTDVFVIYPGGNGKIPVFIPQGATLSLKSLTSTANGGYSIINLFN